MLEKKAELEEEAKGAQESLKERQEEYAEMERKKGKVIISYLSL